MYFLCSFWTFKTSYPSRECWRCRWLILLPDLCYVICDGKGWQGGVEWMVLLVIANSVRNHWLILATVLAPGFVCINHCYGSLAISGFQWWAFKLLDTTYSCFNSMARWTIWDFSLPAADAHGEVQFFGCGQHQSWDQRSTACLLQLYQWCWALEMTENGEYNYPTWGG